MRGISRLIPVHWTIPFCALGLIGASIGLSASALGSATGDSSRTGGPAVATAARTVYLTEKARLRFVTEHGATLVERGYAHGTYNAPITADLTIHSKSVTARVTIYPHGGSLSGSADASYKIVKNLGYFGGTLQLTRGTGRFSHVSEVAHKPLGISGIINRENFEVEVKASGEAAGV
ncbi:MAG TPA: hypothetical protein VHU13_08020 [Solirubrobacteraceae bacterium]|jgi:hypothetical protein|nr:hypothetical protein [Solirubrobacteraceae bacterium]